MCPPRPAPPRHRNVSDYRTISCQLDYKGSAAPQAPIALWSVQQHRALQWAGARRVAPIPVSRECTAPARCSSLHRQRSRRDLTAIAEEIGMHTLVQNRT